MLLNNSKFECIYWPVLLSDNGGNVWERVALQAFKDFQIDVGDLDIPMPEPCWAAIASRNSLSSLLGRPTIKCLHIKKYLVMESHLSYYLPSVTTSQTHSSAHSRRTRMKFDLWGQLYTQNCKTLIIYISKTLRICVEIGFL